MKVLQLGSVIKRDCVSENNTLFLKHAKLLFLQLGARLFFGKLLYVLSVFYVLATLLCLIKFVPLIIRIKFNLITIFQNTLESPAYGVSSAHNEVQCIMDIAS